MREGPKIVPCAPDAAALRGLRHVHQEPAGLGNRRLQIGRSGSFLASPLFENTVLFPHRGAMSLQIRQTLSSLGILVKPAGFAGRRSKSDRPPERVPRNATTARCSALMR